LNSILCARYFEDQNKRARPQKQLQNLTSTKKTDVMPSTGQAKVNM